MELNNGSVLLDFFENHPHRMIHKWMHYFEIYERHFAQFRGQPMSMLEFGVLHGGSLQMWKYYFGKQAQIYGADINPRCAELAEDKSRSCWPTRRIANRCARSAAGCRQHRGDRKARHLAAVRTHEGYAVVPARAGPASRLRSRLNPPTFSCGSFRALQRAEATLGCESEFARVDSGPRQRRPSTPRSAIRAEMVLG
jgi:hypothetical protein